MHQSNSTAGCDIHVSECYTRHLSSAVLGCVAGLHNICLYPRGHQCCTQFVGPGFRPPLHDAFRGIWHSSDNGPILAAPPAGVVLILVRLWTVWGRAGSPVVFDIYV